MNKILKKIAWWGNLSLAYVLIALPFFILAIDSLVVIVLSPFLAFVSANADKLGFPKESWWKLYKDGLILSCTKSLPIVVYIKNG